MAAVDAMT